MQQTGRDVDEVVALHGQVADKVVPAALVDVAAQVLLVSGVVAKDDGGVGLGLEEVPALVLAIGKAERDGVLGVGVDLDGEVVLGAKQRDDDREEAIRVTKELGVLAP